MQMERTRLRLDMGRIIPPGNLPFYPFKSADGGTTLSCIWDGNASVRGVSRIKLDPQDSQVVYISAYQQGIWRSFDGGTAFERIVYATSFQLNTDRTEFDVTLSNGRTRIYFNF